MSPLQNEDNDCDLDIIISLFMDKFLLCIFINNNWSFPEFYLCCAAKL